MFQMSARCLVIFYYGLASQTSAAVGARSLLTSFSPYLLLTHDNQRAWRKIGVGAIPRAQNLGYSAQWLRGDLHDNRHFLQLMAILYESKSAGYALQCCWNYRGGILGHCVLFRAG